MESPRDADRTTDTTSRQERPHEIVDQAFASLVKINKRTRQERTTSQHDLSRNTGRTGSRPAFLGGRPTSRDLSAAQAAARREQESPAIAVRSTLGETLAPGSALGDIASPPLSNVKVWDITNSTSMIKKGSVVNGTEIDLPVPIVPMGSAPQSPLVTTETEAPETVIEENSGPTIPEPAILPGEGETPSSTIFSDNLPTEIPPPDNAVEQSTTNEPFTPFPSGSTASTTTNAPNSCNTLSCKGLALLNNNPLLYIFVFMLVSLLCCLRCKRCARGRQRDSRGEYRAVGRMLANNFDTDLSDEEMNYYTSDEEDGAENGGWSNHDKGAIEMKSVGYEANGGLTLEEMNG